MDKFFWFTQPATILNFHDKFFIILSAVLFLVAILLWIIKRFIQHPVIKKLIGKFIVKDLTIGLAGLVWTGVRYENTPIFARRFWAGLILLILIIWLLFILKYIFFNFFREQKEYQDNLIRSRYLPGSK